MVFGVEGRHRARTCADVTDGRGVGTGRWSAGERFVSRELGAGDRLTSRIEGRVHNDSRYRVTDVRLQVEGLDAVTYRIEVNSFDVVSGGQLP